MYHLYHSFRVFAQRFLLAAVLAHVVAGDTAWAQGSRSPASPKSAPEALSLYTDAANLQNNGEYDLAVESWSKFLRNFSDDPLADRARHYLGVSQTQLRQFDKAAETLSKLVADNAKFEFIEDAYLNLGWAQYSHALAGNRDWFAKAAETFGTLVEKFPNGKYEDQALFYRGESEFLQGNREEAVALYARLVKERPKSKLYADGLYALGVTQQELERHAQAAEAFDTFLQGFPQHELFNEVRMRKAETLLQQGDSANAERLFAQVAGIEGFPSADYALLRQAHCAALQDKYEQAAQLYTRVAEQFPRSDHVAEATMSAGRSFYRAEKSGDAKKWLQKVVQNGEQDSVEAAHWLCRLWLKENQPEKAAQLAAAIVAKSDDSSYLVALKLDEADALFALPERRTDSLERFRDIATQHRNDRLGPQALYNAAYAALDLKEYDEGTRLAKSFIETYPPGHRLLPDVLYVQAECQLLKEEYADAEQIYLRLLTHHGSHADADTWRLRHATTAYAQDKYQAVIDKLSPVVEHIEPAAAVAEGQFLLGLCYAQLQRNEDAARAFDASLAADAQWRQADETLLNLGRARQRLNQLDAAKTALKRLVADFPRSPQLARAYYHLAECDFASQEFNAAATQYAKMVNQWPDSPIVPHALYGQAWAHLREGDHASAIKPLDRLIADYADHQLVTQAHNVRAICRQRTADFQGGGQDVAAFLASEPPRNQRSSALYVRGLCEIGLKKTAEAIGTFQSILDEDSSYQSVDRVLYELGWAHKTLDQPDEAIEFFQRLATGYPKSPLAAEANFHVGERHYKQVEYEAALRAYVKAQESSLEAELGEKLLYKIGWANFKLNRYQAALDAFTQQLAAYQSGSLVADGLFMRAECLFKMEDYARAFSAFKEAGAAGIKSETMRVLTLLHGGQSAAQMEYWDESLKWLTLLTESFPKSPYATEAIYERGRVLQNSDRLDEARQCYQQVTELSRGEMGARARFMLGELYFGQRDFVSAICEFRLLIYGYGGDAASDEIKQWQAKGGLEAGRCAAVLAGQAKSSDQQESLLANARKYLGYVAKKHPNTEEAEAAAEQLKKYGT